MLIEFSVTNFLSFSKKQTLSMVANRSKELEAAHTFVPTSKGKSKFPRLVHAAGIYGANAAGKSNLLLAMKVLRQIILTSAKDSQSGEPIEGIHSHALSEDKPTEFEILFIVNGVRYQYGFAATRELIVEEWLFAFPSGRSQRWFSRVYDTDSKKYHWLINPKIKGERELWKKTTRSNALLLSTAALLNSVQLSPIFEWFRQNLAIETTDDISHIKTFELCKKPDGKLKILDFLNTADISVNDIRLKDKSTELVEIQFSHQTSKGESFQLPLGLESKGTLRLFESAGVFLEILDRGYVICIDEIESSLHPLMTRFLVSLFHNPEVNKNHAQLIFTTHDTNILDDDNLRRDQIWFVEKDANQSTRLYSLADFIPRKNEVLPKGYLQGRYGALPYISSPKWLK